MPADLAAVVVLVVLTNLAVFLPVVRDLPFRVALALPFLIVLPGYALVSLLYPEAASMLPEEDDTGLSGAERAAVSVGLSLVLVPSVVFLVDLSPLRIDTVTVVVGVSLFTLACTAGAVVRRRRLPPAERFAVPHRAWLADLRASVTEGDRTDRALNVTLAVLVVLTVAALVYMVAAPTPTEPYTEYYLATEDEQGELVAEYPQEFERNESAELVVVVENHENERITYTTVLLLERLNENRSEPVERWERDRFRATLADNETRRETHTVTPNVTGENLQLTYLLYRGGAPANPRTETAYRRLNLRIRVSNETA